jgi:microcystin-dependent protein
VTAAADVVINTTGGGQPHDNMPPYLCLTWAVWAE